MQLSHLRPVIFGEVLFDHFPDGSRVLGGAPFNVAWHLRGFGASPLVIAAVGKDSAGREVLDRMASWDLMTHAVQVHRDRPTGRVTAKVVDGENQFEIAPEQAWDFIGAEAAIAAATEQTDQAVPTAPLLYHGTLALRSEVSGGTFRQLANTLDAPAFVDINLRDPWWTRETVEWCLETASWIKLNEHELRVFTSQPTASFEDCRDAALALVSKYSGAGLIVTRGAKGAILVSAGGEVFQAAAPPVTDFVDSVGAGDAFSSVSCIGVLQKWPHEKTLRRAAAFAADVCRIRGATGTDFGLYERHVSQWSEDEDPGAARAAPATGLHVLSLSVHGLVRATDIELGRDPDTGGQVSYVVDQARALAEHPSVERVDVVTRMVQDRRVDDVYAQPFEEISDGARIVRIPFGPKRYLRKETLWPHLDSLLDQLTRYVRTQKRVPDVIHGHYADAGYVGAQLAKLLGLPFVFTGHSLGRVKQARLAPEEAADEKTYRFTQRIEAEERALETAALVIASTHQEVHEQYEAYDHYQPDRMKVIPPGVDLSRFSPVSQSKAPAIHRELSRFLADPSKPMILALARPDERKNFDGLVRAYAETPGLRALGNLVVIAGNRDDITDMAAGSRRVLTQILLLIDRYDLYGSVAYPKHHEPSDVPDLYRLAAQSKGVFVNPALTEPFGLTLLEATATGLPVVATDDGGPQDILGTCQNGLLVDVNDSRAMGEAIRDAISDEPRWERWSQHGLDAVHKNYSWDSHAEHYAREVAQIVEGARAVPVSRHRTKLVGVDRLLVTDVDDTLTGDDEAQATLFRRLEEASANVGFGIATGRTLERALSLFEELDVRVPDVLITASGTELHYGSRLIKDRSWERQIRYRWEPELVQREVGSIPGLSRLADAQTQYRIRYEMDPSQAPTPREIRRLIRQRGLRVSAVFDRDIYVDVVPVRASLGMAIRFFCFKWSLEPERLLVAGDSGNDWDMLSGDTLGVVVGNHTSELERLRGRPRVYFSKQRHAWGVLDGIDWYDFLGKIRVPPEDPK
ncbi:MAG: PfkB family carbohydrate kinase [Myxococcota bacterium]